MSAARLESPAVLIARGLDQLLPAAMVYDRRKIVMHYLKGSFSLDFISSFPLDSVTTSTLSGSASALRVVCLSSWFQRDVIVI